MIMDDDVLFDEATRVGVLLTHLRADPSLALVAGCYAPHDCYAYNLRPCTDASACAGAYTMTSERAVPTSLASEVSRADVVHNLFVARAQVLRQLLPRLVGRGHCGAVPTRRPCLCCPGAHGAHGASTA